MRNKIQENFEKEIIEKSDSHDCKHLINTVKEWVSSHKDAQFLGCYKNKLGSYAVALYSYGVIYLLNSYYSSVMYAPKLLMHNLSNSCIYIDDIITKETSTGNGTALMFALFRYAKENNFSEIKGFLSDIDSDHKDRLLKYYNKFGFTIENNKIHRVLD